MCFTVMVRDSAWAVCMSHGRSPPKTTHPCLRSSSGSGPVELERGAQLLLASEDFILRTRGNKTDAVSTTKNGATSPRLGAHNISVIAQKQWHNRTQVVVSTQKRYFFPPHHQCRSFCYLFNLYLTRAVSWDWRILLENSWQTNNSQERRSTLVTRAI